jgi:hypothetical protein
MEQKTAQEFIGLQSHAASLVAMGVVSPTEGDLAVGHGQKPGVGDGDAVGIAGKVGEDLGGSGKGSLGIDDPVRFGSSAQESGKGGRGLERSELAGESELVFFKGSFEASQELSPEDPTENVDRQKELRSAGNPSAMIGGESSSRDYAMQVGMSEKSLAPSMQNGQKADVGAQVFGIRSDLEESLGRGPKEQAVNQSLILQGQWSQDVGQSEDDMIVGDGQQFGGTLL